MNLTERHPDLPPEVAAAITSQAEIDAYIWGLRMLQGLHLDSEDYEEAVKDLNQRYIKRSSPPQVSNNS